MELILNPEGRYIMAPVGEKVAMLLEHGATEIDTAALEQTGDLGQMYPPPNSKALIVVVENRFFDAALWIQNDYDFKRATDPTDGRRRRFFYMDAGKLSAAPRRDVWF